MNIQAYYNRFEAAQRALNIANTLGQPFRGRALGLYNKHKSALKHAQNGTTAPARFNPHFETRIQGLPCWISVTYYEPPQPTTFNFEGSCAYAEYYVVNESGYRMRFMEEKISEQDERRILSEIEERAGK